MRIASIRAEVRSTGRKPESGVTMRIPEILKVKVGPLTFEHPFILASAPPTATGPMIRTAFSYGWSGAVTKTIKPDDI